MMSGAGAPAAVRAPDVARLDPSRTVVLSFGPATRPAPPIELAGVDLIVSSRRNVIVAHTGIGIGAGDSIGLFGADLRDRGQRRARRDRGIDLGGRPPTSRLPGHGQRRARPRRTWPSGPPGAVAPGGSLE